MLCKYGLVLFLLDILFIYTSNVIPFADINRYGFALIPGMGGYGVALQQLSMIYVFFDRGVVLPAAESFFDSVTFGILGTFQRVYKC